jgi:hypothetical protein
MPITIRSTQRLIPQLRYYDANKVLISTSEALVYKTRSIINDAAKDSRPYPTGNPRYSPTGQPEQYRKLYKDGVMESPFLPFYTIWKKSQSQVLSPDVFLDVFPSQLDWQTKMRLEIKDLAVNLGTSLVEYRQTADMFQRFASGAAGAWRRFRSARSLKGRKRLTPCDVAAAELTASYGLEPLANDLFDSAMALQHRLEFPIYTRFVSKQSDRGTATRYAGGDVSIDWQMSQRAICYVKISPNYNQFTIGNPAELAWEVVPFSFVVDWAIPIGDALSALDALTNVDGLIGTVTTKRKYRHNFIPNNVLSDGYLLLNPSSMTYEGAKRDVIYSIPLPRVPTWNPSKSWRAITHGISLLTTLNKRCSQRNPWR